MEMNEFKTQIYRLQKTYGTETYPKESCLALWECLKHVSSERFKKAIDRVLAVHVNIRFAPGLDKIEQALEGIRVETHDEIKQIKKEIVNPALKAKPRRVARELEKILKDIQSSHADKNLSYNTERN